MVHRVKNQLIGAFSTSNGFGNPVYIIYDYGKWDTETRQKITSFVNLSECVFVNAITQQKITCTPIIELRIFNPNSPMKFAGHPLIGAIRSFRETLGIDEGIIDTGDMQVKFHSTETQGGITSCLEIPNPVSEKFQHSAELCQVLSIPKQDLPIYDCGPRHVFLRVPSLRMLREFDPHWVSLSKFKNIALNVYFAKGKYVENRMFSPSYGVYEDRATGTAVIPILKEIRKSDSSLDHIEVTQGVSRSSGVLMNGNYSVENTIYTLSGMTTIVAEGGFTL
ncbi:PhzF family phenazine biosynthesis isomerase [Corynebacterium ulcerans]|uniref:PhzF family phenazine biosynthesis isomerase n=1 Tax=Corynebacterium ulcerans TaxID=65058 RepID=UPI0013033415|nr:PhzF family phenazine biosynthesis isomerase [Corynebacterium ulcerans]MBL4943501.1 PhzF family phenazine biosynthesis protein [Corynebacterium ulcerans]QGZ24707.1 PhzF family phenazine biosynthesis isomerase [Corynebacterium ulcerans]QOE23420.1 PhzF family phenazine biosynthesis protein [Corynebacterium ulcerans]